jgi:hypothetical protein
LSSKKAEYDDETEEEDFHRTWRCPLKDPPPSEGVKAAVAERRVGVVPAFQPPEIFLVQEGTRFSSNLAPQLGKKEFL